MRRCPTLKGGVKFSALLTVGFFTNPTLALSRPPPVQFMIMRGSQSTSSGKTIVRATTMSDKRI